MKHKRKNTDPGECRDLESVLEAALVLIEEKFMTLFGPLKQKVDGLVSHVDALDTKLQAVKTELAAFIANNGSLNAADQAELQAIMDTIDAEDAKVVADTN